MSDCGARGQKHEQDVHEKVKNNAGSNGALFSDIFGRICACGADNTEDQSDAGRSLDDFEDNEREDEVPW
jgi:hypothetical protein